MAFSLRVAFVVQGCDSAHCLFKLGGVCASIALVSVSSRPLCAILRILPRFRIPQNMAHPVPMRMLARVSFSRIDPSLLG